ncbi:MAG TPA: type II toxin-antitoxin system RelE/ParE family toxin [Bryobacteraceae bacterium]
MYRVVSTIEAENDLKRAAAYIRRDSPSAARRWLKQMRLHIQSLARHPERCPFAPEAESFGKPIRHLLCGSGNRGTYRVLFTIKDEFVAVFHVRHGSMLPLAPPD